MAACARLSGSSLLKQQPCPFRHRLLDTIHWHKGRCLVAVAVARLVVVVVGGGPGVGALGVVGSQRCYW